MRIEWSGLPVTPGMRTGATRRAIAGQSVSAVRVETEPTASFDGRLHAHANEQLLIMIEGTIKLAVGETSYWIEPGEMAFIPSGVVHGAVDIGDAPATYYEIFAPARLDQLPGYLGPTALEYPA